MISKRTIMAALAALAVSAPAHADLSISAAVTQNMSCSGGTCVPTFPKAVLNVNDLENDLSQFGNVRVMTTGNGVEATDIIVKSSLSSPDSTSLTLEAHKAITINAAVSIGSGTAELELQSDTRDATDALSFGQKGHITLGSLSDIFGINGGIFTLVGSVHGLASAVAANPSGAFALAISYDATGDGTYTRAPVAHLSGTFDGLGNTISNVSINQPGHKPSVGLVGLLDAQGAIEHLRLKGIRIKSHATNAGGLVGNNEGNLFQDSAQGNVKGSHFVGGLVGSNGGLINETSTRGSVVTASRSGIAGGLVGLNVGDIQESWSSARIASPAYIAGGLVGIQYYQTGKSPIISDCYAVGSVTAGRAAGGFAGDTYGAPIQRSYSTGAVSASLFSGGFLGEGGAYGGLTDDYWDTETSGVDSGTGDDGNISGLTGETTAQLQSGLPAGFDPKTWAEKSVINNGLPYLIDNLPPK